jgi:hypothetical protein
LAALRFSGHAPDRVVLIGVEPDCLDLTMELSPRVAACMDQVLSLVTMELAALGVPALPRG